MSNKLPKQPKVGQRKCIFCGGLPLTKEHIIPDWIKAVIPFDNQTKNNLSVHTSISTSNEVYLIENDYKVKNGHRLSKKLLIVCRDCNGGWMSMLQKATKSILSSLILDEDITLQTDDILKLTKWIVMTTMVAEYDDIKAKKIPISDLREFRENHQTPARWKIWIGRYNGSRLGFHHNGFRVRNGCVPYSINNIDNLQTSTFFLSGLIIFVMSTNSIGVYREYNNIGTIKLARIYPMLKNSDSITDKPIPWQSLKVVDDTDVEHLIANIF
ncbi:hypothetical protein ABIC45_000323 [Mucilaginibacter rubeus]|uniref:hypothetical protein n=1 Tax=Mucilaginibacter rubeus TaxID=2027860 RepID=UPI00339B0142